MTTNDATRTALVDKAELADRIAALITLRTQWSPIDRALEIIDTVLADRAVPDEVMLGNAYNTGYGAALTTRAVPEPDAVHAIERAAKAIAEMYPPRQSKHDGYVKPVWDMADIEDLAEHALKAAGSDADWLDRELDALSPDYSIYTGTGWGNTRYVAEILADDATDSHGATVIATGTGPTRIAAIKNAVEKAKEVSNE